LIQIINVALFATTALFKVANPVVESVAASILVVTSKSLILALVTDTLFNVVSPVVANVVSEVSPFTSKIPPIVVLLRYLMLLVHWYLL
jgi:hypothetical protein